MGVFAGSTPAGRIMKEMKTEIKGNGFFTPREYNESFSHCDICNEPMSIRKDVHGPTGFAEAMAKRKHVHIEITCPFRHDMWHIQVFLLRREAGKTISKTIENLLLAEIEEILENRQHTKEVSHWNSV